MYALGVASTDMLLSLSILLLIVFRVIGHLSLDQLSLDFSALAVLAVHE